MFGEVSLSNYATIARLGSQGDEVLSIQRSLQLLGYDIGLADGVYGTVTGKAVWDFQGDHGIPQNGEVDQRTWEAIHNEASKVVSVQPLTPASDKVETKQSFSPALLLLALLALKSRG